MPNSTRNVIPEKHRDGERPSTRKRAFYATSDVFVLGLTILFFTLLFLLNFSEAENQHFSHLARSFLAGKTYFVEWPNSWVDLVPYRGHNYWHLGPMPAIILIPFVAIFDAFGKFFYQGYLQPFLTLATFFLCWQLARRHGYGQGDSGYLAFAFCFAGVYQLVAFLSWSWYFSQALAVFLCFLAIAEYLGRQRWWLLGTIMGLVFMTRFTAGIGVLFFLADILTRPGQSWQAKARWLTELLLPVILCGLLLLGYNYVRFDAFFDNGYMRTLPAELTASERQAVMRRGLFSLRYVPTNFYYYFIKTVSPVLTEPQAFSLRPPYVAAGYPGVGFFFVAPIFLYAFRARWRERIVRLALLPVGVTLGVLLTYYWPGWTQVGPRYTLDFLPFCYLMLLYAFPGRRLPRKAKILIVASAFLDLFLFNTLP
jgi:hypothetical protein